MNEKGIRVISMLVCAVLLVLCVCGLGNKTTQIPIEDIDLKQADFDDFINIIWWGCQSSSGVVFSVIQTIGYSFIIFIISLIYLLVWKLCFFNRNAHVVKKEMHVAELTYIGVVIASFIFGVICSGFRCISTVLSMSIVVEIMFCLLCFVPYLQAYKKSKKAEKNYES